MLKSSVIIALLNLTQCKCSTIYTTLSSKTLVQNENINSK
jgi:hypothetical protein